MSEDNTDKKLKELREESVSGGGNRLESEGTGAPKSFEDLVIDALDEVEDGDIHKTISFWDPRLAALLAALEEDEDRLEQIVADLQRELGQEVNTDDADRPEVLRLAIRHGLQEVDEELFEEASEAQTKRALEEGF